MFPSEFLSDATVVKYNSVSHSSSFPLNIWLSAKFQNLGSILKVVREKSLKAKARREVLSSVAEPRAWILEITRYI